MVRGRGRMLALVAYAMVLAVLVLGASLRPGYALSYDMVFTPRESLLPWTLGVGSGFPRSVPQDAVVAVLSSIIPGWILQKVALLAALVLAGVGAGRLVQGPGMWLAATLAVWTPFVAERLLIGHWSLLLAYAALPWMIACLVQHRWAAAVLWCALASLTPSGGLLAVAVCAPVMVISSTRAVGRVVWPLAVIALQLPWILPSIAHGQVAVDPTHAFALRPEGPWGAVLTALSTGGIWNSETVLPSRTWWVAPIAALLVMLIAAWGWRRVRRDLGRTIAAVWLVVACGGLLVALLSALAPSAFEALVAAPGGGLVRDAHKLLAPLAMLLAVCAGAGLSRVCAAIPDRSVAGGVCALVVLAPIAVMPDLVWGGLGRLASVDYPADFQVARSMVGAAEVDAVSLPWTAFRDFAWNQRRTALDPVPRYLQTTVLVDGTLLVQQGSEVVKVGGDDPRAQEVTERLARGESLAEFGPQMGIGYAVVAHDVRGPDPSASLRGASIVYQGDSLSVYGWPTQGRLGASAWLWPIAAVDLAVAAGLAALGASIATRRLRRRSEVLVSDQSLEQET